MAATPAISMTWLWLLLMGGGGAMPLGGAPLPLDPALSAIAPEECLWYTAYAGMGAADAGSANQTEQLFAEPQVQRFVEEVQTQVMRAVRRAGGPEREKRVVIEQAPKLLRALVSRPYAAYVEEVTPREGDGVDVSAAFVLNAGDQRADVEGAIEELLKLTQPDRPALVVEEVAGVEWRRVPTPPEAPAVRFGWKDDYFIVAVGEETPTAVLERMDGDAPAWLTEIREEHPIERELTLGYLNVAGILERVRPYAEAEDPKAWPAVETLGLTHIAALHGISGYDGTACKSIGHIVTDGERAGLLGLLPYKELAKRDLQPIPRDALFALAMRLDAGQAYDHGVAIGSELEPRAKDDAERAMWEVETKLGVNVREDILGSLDDAWVVYVPGGELMLSWLNATAAVKVKDADTLQGAIEKLVDAAQAEMGRHGEGAAITESKLGEHTLYSVQLPAPAPVSPSWCVGDDWLVVSLSPGAVRSALERKGEESLSEVDAVRETLDADGGVAALAYQDTPQLVNSLYPWLQIGLQMASGELRKNGVEIDPTILPAKEVIVKHLSPGVAGMRHGSDGFRFTSRHSLPSGGGLATTGPVGAVLVLPAITAARDAAKSAQSQNNMKQIALAMLNYESAHGKFPTDIYSENGKPLMSWRVRLLPFMEQQALYDQLKLDEPWDSEHNRRFTSTVVPTFDSPTSPGGGKTRYLALKSPETLFRCKDATLIKEITDGTSNTVAFVEAAPDRAAPWAKPTDIKFNAEKPVEGLASPDGSFLAAFCDGSVREMAAGTDPELVKAFATYAGGEPVSMPAP